MQSVVIMSKMLFKMKKMLFQCSEASINLSGVSSKWSIIKDKWNKIRNLNQTEISYTKQKYNSYEELMNLFYLVFNYFSRNSNS